MKIKKIMLTSCIAVQLLCTTAISSNCVYAADAAPSVNSAIGTVNTLLDAPNWYGQQTDGYKGSSKEENYIIVRWNKVEGATEYILSINGAEVKTTENAYFYEGCDFSKSNIFKVKAVNENGESDWSEENIFSACEESKLDVPNWYGQQTDGYKGSSKEENYIIVRWNKLEGATEYILSINGAEVRTTENAYFYEGCDFSMLNIFKVKAVNENGESDWSEENIFSVWE